MSNNANQIIPRQRGRSVLQNAIPLAAGLASAAYSGLQQGLQQTVKNKTTMNSAPNKIVMLRANQGGNAGGGKRRRGRRNNNKQPGPGLLITDKTRVRLEGYYQAVFDAAGAEAYYRQITCLAATGSQLGNDVPKLSTFANMFKYSYINRVIVEYIPTCGYTASGFITFGIDPNVSATAPTAISDVVRHSHSVMTDVKRSAMIVVDGHNLRQSHEYPLIHDNTASDEQKYAGVIQAYGTADVNLTAGYYRVAVDVEFSQLTAA